MKKQINVGIGDYFIANTSETLLATYALGSCVAVILTSSKKVTSAMIHSVMPSKGHHVFDIERPGYYVDEGLPKMIEGFMKITREPSSSILCWVVGGASARSFGETYHIGGKNVQHVKTILKTYGIRIQEMVTGGYKSRTVFFDVDTKAITIQQHDVMI